MERGTDQVTQDIGIGRGRSYALNFPLRDGITNENYKSIFEPVSGNAFGCYGAGTESDFPGHQ